MQISYFLCSKPFSDFLSDLGKIKSCVIFCKIWSPITFWPCLLQISFLLIYSIYFLHLFPSFTLQLFIYSSYSGYLAVSKKTEHLMLKVILYIYFI